MTPEIKEFTDIDSETVDKIVQKMKQKESGNPLTAVDEEATRLHKQITGKKQIELSTIEDLLSIGSPLIKKLAQLYMAIQDPLKPLSKFIAKLSTAQTLQYYLYSANMKYSTDQYLALVTASTFISFLFGALLGLALCFAARVSLILYPLLAILFGLIAGGSVMYLLLLTPANIANRRGAEISLEMPFALRHMATELKSGAGIYRTLQLIATADYGTLSEEFARTINEIEEGIDAKDALKNMGLRVQSQSMKNALNHIIRAMKTGGNLSEVMSDIAEDVSVEIRSRISEFSEKMNFFGVIFIFLGIVFPVMVAILGGIVNAPLPVTLNIPLNPGTLLVFYFVVMPITMGYLIFYLKSIQPRV